MRTLLVCSALALLSSCAGSTSKTEVVAAKVEVPPDSPSYDAAFWATWADGRAELAGYDLTYPRYGKPRKGVAVSIFVTETFSNSARVKSDPGKHPPRDEFPVMKLNLVKDYQTGIYDYNDMLSSFVALAPVNGYAAGSLTKASFSSQEWCGLVYQQALFNPAGVRWTSHSYFDSDGDQNLEIEPKSGAISEDALFLWARGMARPTLSPGETTTAAALTALQRSRETHQPVSWDEVTLSRSAGTTKVRVPAGSFDVETWSAKLRDGSTRTFLVEKAVPHRIVRWETTAGERAELLASDRLKYWEMNAPSGEDALKKLGLSVRGPRTP